MGIDFIGFRGTFDLVDKDIQKPIEYCLYARKSSESDERQAMSIDSQVKEMYAMAKRDNLEIKEIRQESHSAKESGQRPVFNSLLSDLRKSVFNGILTWAPDRLSRNAGDLGMLVDLMDQGKLAQIRTFSQSFSNNPNEKFLLMILCSQAKLENDNRGINVKRGIRAKCEMGWRPGPPPIGYFNRSFAGTKDIVIDPDRAETVKEMFHRVAELGHSGRVIKIWMDKEKFTTRAGKSLPLSQIYQILKNPFYYGRFEYPVKSGIWYQGKHPPLITKEIYNQVQHQLITAPKAKWGSKVVIFKGLFKCGRCKDNIIGEEKIRKVKVGPSRRHVYYHCARQMGECREDYINEEKLIKEIIRYINFMEIAHPNFLNFEGPLSQSIETYRTTREEILYQQNINPKCNPMGMKEYSQYILYNGTIEEKRDLVKALGRQMYIQNQTITSSPTAT